MRRAPRAAGLRAVAAAGLLLAVSGCQRSAPAAAAPGGAPAAPGAAAPALPVAVVQAAASTVPAVIEVPGRTEGSREVEVRARVSGILEKQLFVEGDTVRAGAPLYRIDRAPFEIALAQARAQLEQERSRLARAQIEARRLKQLVDERAISQREYDDATAAQQQTTATLALAQARVREAELNLSYTTVSAPIAGITGRNLRSEGSLVTANTEASLLTTIAQANPIWVRFSLSEAENRQLRGARADAEAPRVTLVGQDGRPVGEPGRLNFAASAVDTRLGTVQVRAEFPNAKLALLPGQFVQVRLEAGQAQGFLVPQQAVQQNEQGRFVWVVSEDGKATPRPVDTGTWVGSDWAIRGGLNAGDRVIVDNLIKLRPGVPVQPVAAAAPTARPGS